jgi:hypothetical protein
MKLPTMCIIFNKDMADKLSCGIKCAFSAHASMWLFEKTLTMSLMEHPNLVGSLSIDLQYSSMEIPNTKLYHKEFQDWYGTDYRKFIITSDKQVEELFEMFKREGVPVYMQKTSHDITIKLCERCERNECGCNYTNDINKIIKSGTSICVSVFLWKDTHKQLVKDMELM